MSEKEKLALLEEMLEMEEGELEATQKISDIDVFDSMARLSLIVLFEDELDKKITGDDIDKFVTIQDILDAME